MKLYLAEANSRSGNCRAAIEDINKVIGITGIKGSLFELDGLSIRAFCYVETKLYPKAIPDYTTILKTEKSKEVEELLKDAVIMTEKEKMERAPSDSSGVSVK